jgi:ABC-type bacteriocin/lantibiotic exporter with double-glycine peptidase domain
LLDDPLSAVDPAVANGIFQDCILGELKSKCVVLVTHQLQFVRQCKKILVLKHGKQSMLGSFEEILKEGYNIDKILNQYNKSL